LKGSDKVPVSEPHFVPKVHPATRAVEVDDPMMLYACPTGGDPELMIQCLVQEYAWMGFDGQAIMRLFHDSEYPALNALLAHYGANWVLTQVQNVLAATGVHRFSGIVVDEAAEVADKSEVVELGIARLNMTRSKRRAAGERSEDASGQ
jgi:hypothetical protein